jgi:hypothetical protein
MAKPTLTATGVEHADGSTLTGWDSPTELGSTIMAWAVSTDFFIEGTNALGMEQKTGTGVKGARFNLASTTDFTVTNRKLQILVWITSVAIVNSLANGGVRIYAHDGTDYAFWYVGGNDVSWVGNGWKLISIDLNTTPDYDNATFDPSTVDYVGAAVNFTGTLGRADGFAIDLVRHIDSLEAKGGSLRHIDGTNGTTLNENGASADQIIYLGATTDYWTGNGYEVGDIVEVRGSATAANDGRYTIASFTTTTTTNDTIVIGINDLTADDTANTTLEIEAEFTFQDIINEDQVNNSFWYGTVVAGDTGSFEINGNLIIGDVSGADYTSFRSENEIIVFPDNNLTTGMNEISVAEDTGETRFKIGTSNGTGADKIGYNGSVFYSAPEVYTPVYGLDLSASITECLIYGSTFQNAEDGITLSASATDNEWISNTVVASGEVNSDNAIVRKSFFNATSSDSTAAAFLWVTNTDIQECSFLVNTGTNISAIRHTDGTTRTYTDLIFSGNTYDVFLNHATASLTINKVGDSNPSTWRSSGSGSVTFTGSVPLTITVLDGDNDNNPINLAQTAIYEDNAGVQGSELMNEDTNASGIASESYTGSTPQDVFIRVRKSSSGTQRYFPIDTAGTIVANTGLVQTIVMRQDDIASA